MSTSDQNVLDRMMQRQWRRKKKDALVVCISTPASLVMSHNARRCFCSSYAQLVTLPGEHPAATVALYVYSLDGIALCYMQGLANGSAFEAHYVQCYCTGDYTGKLCIAT